MATDRSAKIQSVSDADGRLARIAVIIEIVDRRCMAFDGPVPPTLSEMTQDEISRIYALAKGMPENWKP